VKLQGDEMRTKGGNEDSMVATNGDIYIHTKTWVGCGSGEEAGRDMQVGRTHTTDV
jgi:hypothetical protein